MTTPRGRALYPGGFRSAVRGPAVVPSRPTTPPKPQKERAPIPAALSQPAPLWLGCEWCGLPQLARADGVLLWHRVQRDGEWYQCTGTNSRGLPLEEVGQ